MTTHLARRLTAARTPVLAALLMAALIASAPLPARAGETITDPGLGFKLTLPDGFTAIAEPEKLMPAAYYAYFYGDEESETLRPLLIIVKQSRPLPHVRMQQSDLAPGFAGQLHRTIWQGLEVPLVEVPEEVDGTKAITLSVLIPLERQGLNLKLVGPPERKEELRALLDKVVAGLNGSSNWPYSPTALNRPVGRTEGITIMIVTFLLAMIVMWLISKYCPRGTLLALSLFFWVGSQNVPPETTGVGVFIRAPMGFIGFVGVVLGIIDAVRRRKPRPKSVPNASEQPRTQIMADPTSQPRKPE